jgi:outer membrane protein assembly factor BamB
MLLLTAGCSTIRLDRPIVPQEGDWPTYGRTPERTGAVPANASFPLEMLWEYDTKAGMAEGGLLAADSLIIAATMRGELHVVRLQDGKRVAATSVGDAIHGTPVLFGNNVIIPLTNSGHAIAAFDITRGRTAWTCERGEVEGSLLLLDNRLFAGTLAGEFLALDPASGEVLWTFALPDNVRKKGIRSTPAAWQGSVIFGADNGRIYALDAKSGARQWECRVDGPVIAPPVVDRNGVFVGTLAGTLYAIDPAKGTVLWHAKAEGPISGHALLTDSAAIVGTNRGSILSFGRSDGKLQWKGEAGGPVVAGPVRYGDAAVAGTLRRDLVALRCADGEVLWRQGVEGRVRTAPIVARGIVLVATDQQTLRAYRGGTAQ